MTEPEKTLETFSDTVESALEPSLSERIEAARERSNELASTATKSARDFVHDHPVATIAGGIAIGALIAGAFASRLPRKTASAAKAAGSDIDVISDRLSHLASLGADLALAYVARAAVAGKDGVGKFEERFGEQLSKLNDEAGKTTAQASRKASGLADLMISTLRDASETALSRLNKIKKD